MTAVCYQELVSATSDFHGRSGALNCSQESQQVVELTEIDATIPGKLRSPEKNQDRQMLEHREQYVQVALRWSSHAKCSAKHNG